MKPAYTRNRETPALPDERSAELDAREPRAGDVARGERRSRHRVDDDQKSGQGSLSALSKMKMLERKREAIKPARDEG